MLRSAAKMGFAAADLLLPPPKGPRLLIYHQVGLSLGRQMEVTVTNFRRQLDWLAENREVVALQTAVHRWQEDGSERLVVLTFDDGYRDIYATAFPLLKERGMPFTLYLTTEPIETGTARNGMEKAEPLTWRMIDEMLISGLATIGSHTHTHRDLRHATGAEIEQEVTTSDGLIRSRLGVMPRHFAYPWGYWSSRADALVKVRYASAVLGGSPRPDPSPPVHLLHRYPIQLGDGLAFFRARLRGGLLFEERVRRRLRGYFGP